MHFDYLLSFKFQFVNWEIRICKGDINYEMV